MATVKEIKKELDENGIEYDQKANKADLEALLPQKTMSGITVDETDSENESEATIVASSFIDPNASEGTQAK